MHKQKKSDQHRIIRVFKGSILCSCLRLFIMCSRSTLATPRYGKECNMTRPLKSMVRSHSNTPHKNSQKNGRDGRRGQQAESEKSGRKPHHNQKHLLKCINDKETKILSRSQTKCKAHTENHKLYFFLRQVPSR